MISKRWLIALGCSSYDHLPRLTAVPGVLERAEALFGKLGYETVPSCDPETLTEVEFQTQLMGFCGNPQLREEDIVVFWFSGHGYASVREPELRLQLKDTNPEFGVKVPWVCDTLAHSRIERALLIWDCCLSATSGLDMLKAVTDRLIRDASRTDRSPQPYESGFANIAAVTTLELAAQGGLVNALEYAVLERRLGGFDQPFLDPIEVIGAANERLGERGLATATLQPGPTQGAKMPVFPNPHLAPKPPHLSPAGRGPTRRLADGPRRLLLTISCAEYDDQNLLSLRLVPEVLRRVERLFCGDGDAWLGLGYERVELGLAESPTEAEMAWVLAQWSARADLRPDDIVAIWVVAHSAVDDKGRFRLQLRDSAPGGGVTTDIFGWLLSASPAQRCLVVVDCSYAATMTQELALAGFGVRAVTAQEWPADAGLVLVAASGASESTAQGGLAAALEHTLLERRLGGFNAPVLDPRRVVEAVNESLGQRGWTFQAASLLIVGAGTTTVPVFPNPHFDDGPIAAIGEMVSHWDPVARGVSWAGAEGWLFTGRDEALRQINDWLRAEDT